jgi:hypothetical protein
MVHPNALTVVRAISPERNAMFSGIQEILLIVIIVGAIFLIPRMTTPRTRQPRMASPPRDLTAVSVGTRVFIVLSIFWVMAWSLYLRPWQQDPIAFAAFGLGPVAAAWSLKWILAGKKKKR